MENKLEWIFNTYDIHHEGCLKGVDGPVWDSKDLKKYVFSPEKLWCCLFCGKKVPDHIILQWRLLSGQ